jgi:hypothetical protein
MSNASSRIGVLADEEIWSSPIKSSCSSKILSYFIKNISTANIIKDYLL